MLNPRLRFDPGADRISRVASSWHISIFAVPILAQRQRSNSKTGRVFLPHPARLTQSSTS